jgi:GR25 family glycosyltransferase involved in LPS biosynthesis
MMPVYVISLPDAHERRRTMRERLDALGFSFKFFDAFDGRKPLEEKPGNFIVDRISKLPETQYAGALSHLQLARRIGEGESAMTLVFEDDAILPAGLPGLIDDAERLRFDILKLEGIARPNRPFLSRGSIGRYELRVYSHVSMGAAAYILTRGAARKLLASIPIVNDTADELISKSKLDIVELHPYPVRQDGSPTQQSRPPLRPGFSRRMRNNFSRRARIVELYGWRAYLAMERQKYFPTR